MYRIFVNYRQGSHSMAVKGLTDALERHFGRHEVFLDAGIPEGANYARELEIWLHSCDVLVAVIHEGWDDTFTEQRWKDWVHYEIATALKRGITVIPVLLENAGIPEWKKLPEDIADINLRQHARLRAATYREDVDRLIRRIEHNLGGDADTSHTPVAAKPKRTVLHIAALAVVLFLMAIGLFLSPGPAWRVFALPAFVSTVMLAAASTLTVIATWSLRRLGHRWEQRAGTRTHREALSRNWILPALLIVASAAMLSRAMTEDGRWEEWEWWYAVILVLFAAFFLHRWWRRTTEGDDVWPPPVTTDHWVFRRAALRLHDKLRSDDAEWRHPRSYKAQRQAESVYFALGRTREELARRAALPLMRWIRNGYSAETTVYIGWFASIVLLEVASVAALVFGDPVPGSPYRLIAITVAAATVFTGAMVVTNFLLDRYRTGKWIEELTEWQQKLGPLVLNEG